MTDDSASDPASMIVMTDGYSWIPAVWRKLQELQDRGVRFIPMGDEHFDLEPARLVTEADIRFLKTYKEEAIRILRYEGPAVIH